MAAKPTSLRPGHLPPAFARTWGRLERGWGAVVYAWRPPSWTPPAAVSWATRGPGCRPLWGAKLHWKSTG